MPSRSTRPQAIWRTCTPGRVGGGHAGLVQGGVDCLFRELGVGGEDLHEPPDGLFRCHALLSSDGWGRSLTVASVSPAPAHDNGATASTRARLACTRASVPHPTLGKTPHARNRPRPALAPLLVHLRVALSRMFAFRRWRDRGRRVGGGRRTDGRRVEPGGRRRGRRERRRRGDPRGRGVAGARTVRPRPVRDVVAIDVGAALATDRGLFRLSADGVVAFDAPEVAGCGGLHADLRSYAIGADGATLTLDPRRGPWAPWTSG